MNLGEAMFFFALAGWFASPFLLVYALVAWLAFHIFVVLYEEPQQMKRYGGQYLRYRTAVHWWIPAVRIPGRESF